MKRKLLSLSLLSFLLLPLCSCGYNDSFVVERSLKDELVDISFDEFKEKVENNDRFISLFYSEECYACDMLKNDFLEDFIKDCNDNQIEGTYTMYVDTSLLPVGIMSAKSKLLKLLEPSLKNTNIVIECISVDAINYSYDNGFYADVFVINVSYND